MYPKQIVLLVVEFVTLAQGITSGFEIISTTTERGVNKDDGCQQEIIKILGHNLREQQNLWIVNKDRWQHEMMKILGEQQHFWIGFYNNSFELQSQKQMQQTRKEIVQIFDKKLVEFGKNQKELIEVVSQKQNDLLQHFDKKLKEMEAQFASKQEAVLKKFNEEIEKIASHLGKVENGETALPKNCLEVLKRGNTVSGVYTIRPKSDSTSFEVWCDMGTRGGGWTYVLNRFDGSQEFYLDWQNYKNGFGNLSGEFWLGLDHLYELTDSADNHLLIELVEWDNKHFHAVYDLFRIGNEEEGYPLKVLNGYSGDAGDSLIYHKNMRFSTYDRDQDEWPQNCATTFHGAWWYKNCHHSNLAGTYFNTAKEDTKGMVWKHIHSRYISLKKAKMMVRPD